MVHKLVQAQSNFVRIRDEIRLIAEIGLELDSFPRCYRNSTKAVFAFYQSIRINTMLKAGKEVFRIYLILLELNDLVSEKINSFLEICSS